MADITNRVLYRRYHSINMSDLCSGLKNTPFIRSPANSVVDLHEPYLHNSSGVLDRQAPLVSRLPNKDFEDGLLLTCKAPVQNPE